MKSVKNKLATAVIVGLLAGLVPITPAVAHRGKCLPGKLTHKQCHRTYKAARNRLGIPKKVILKRIWRHKKRIKSIPVRYKVSRTKRYYKLYGPTAAEGESKGTKTISAYVDAKAWKIDCLEPCVPYPGATLASFNFYKTWKWKNFRVKKKGLSYRYDPDVTTLGKIQGWNYRRLVGESHRWEAEEYPHNSGIMHPHFWHHSTVQPRFEVCLPLWELVCFEDKTPTLHIWGGGFGNYKRWVERD